MNAFGFSSILILASSSIMGILIFLKARESRTAVILGSLCFVVATWGLGGYKFSTTLSEKNAFFWWQIGYICAIFSPVLFLHFILSYLNLDKKFLLSLSYLIATIFLAMNFFAKDVFLGHLRFAFNQFYWHDWWQNKNLTYLIYYISFYWILLFYPFSLLLKALQSSTGKQRNQIKYLLLASIITWPAPHLTHLINFGLDIYPLANFLLAFYPVILGYAIVRHQLMDINVFLRKGLVYSILITFLTLIYLISILFFERLFQHLVGYQTAAESIFPLIIIAIIFIPLRTAIQSLIDHLFYQGTPDEIAQQNELLRREVAQSEKLKAVATLASGMAHEIKNPLTAIQTFTEYLPQRQNDPEFLNKFSTIVGKEVNRINDLVHQLLDFAKPSPLALRPTNIHALLDGIIDFLNNEFLKKNISIIKTYNASQHKDIPADANKLKQAFLNILLNAIEACPNGGRIEVSTSNPNPKEFEIRISDNGPGIDEKNLKYIFDPFFTTKDHGTGLGLSITKGIITDHGGEIKAQSKINYGTVLIITFIIFNNQ